MTAAPGGAPDVREPSDVARKAWGERDPFVSACLARPLARGFLKKGDANATLDDIIDRSGGSRQTLYSLFGGKQGLLEALIAELGAEIFAPFHAEGLLNRLPDEVLVEVGIRYLKTLTTPDALGVHRVIVAEGVVMRELAERYWEIGPAHTRAPPDISSSRPAAKPCACKTRSRPRTSSGAWCWATSSCNAWWVCARRRDRKRSKRSSGAPSPGFWMDAEQIKGELKVRVKPGAQGHRRMATRSAECLRETQIGTAALHPGRPFAQLAVLVGSSAMFLKHRRQFHHCKCAHVLSQGCQAALPPNTWDGAWPAVAEGKHEEIDENCGGCIPCGFRQPCPDGADIRPRAEPQY